MKIIELFSGIGGFTKGFIDAGYEIEEHYFSEIDKHAIANYKYNFPHAKYIGSVTDIRPEDFRGIDILTGGFPCQPFSLAGKRLGFEDTRGTMFFEIIRILLGCKPKCVVLENVKGLLNHDGGRTFATIFRLLTEIGYTVEFQLLNTKWFLPQNRERIYIIGHLAERSRLGVFPIGKDIGRFSTKLEIENTASLKIKSATKRGYETALPGDSINFSVPSSETRRGRVGKGVAQTLDTQCSQGVLFESNIRRLTEIECERLQGFPDNWTEFGNYDGEVKEIPKTQRYKMLGNAVTVKVVEEIAKRISLC